MRLVAALATFLLVACASGPGNPRDRYDRLLTPRANPGKVVATELAFARAAQEDGQWTAFADYSTDDAVMFVPEPVNAHTWLKGRANPARAVQWQPHEVWSSCDGSLAVTKGAWQRPDGTVGYFTTVWERQKDGEYEWVLDQGDVLPQPLKQPEFIKTEIAECKARNDQAFDSEEADWEANKEAAGIFSGGDEASDGTLVYRYSANGGQSRQFEVFLLKDDKMTKVMSSKVGTATE